MKTSNLPEKMLIFVAEASLNTIHLSHYMALLCTANNTRSNLMLTNICKFMFYCISY